LGDSAAEDDSLPSVEWDKLPDFLAKIEGYEGASINYPSLKVYAVRLYQFD